MVSVRQLGIEREPRTNDSLLIIFNEPIFSGIQLLLNKSMLRKKKILSFVRRANT